MSRRRNKTPSQSSSEPTASDTPLPTELADELELDTIELSAAEADALEQRAEEVSNSTAPDILTALGLDVTRYARLIVYGEIIACIPVRQACQRHLDDLVKSENPDYPYRFDPGKAGRLIFWLQQMPHVEGHNSSPTLVLELWQRFVWGSVFGWVKKASGFRRFTKAFVFVPRKNGKTTPVAGIGFFGMALDGELGAQVFNGANKRKQAEVLFRFAKLMLRRAAGLFKRLGIEKRGESSITMDSTGSFWQPVTKSPGDGGGAHYWIQDEYHEAKNSLLRDTMVDGQTGRMQPLAIFISTFGHNLAGPCYSDWLLVQRLLAGTIELDHVFAIAYTIDLERYTDPFGVEHEPDEWTSIASAMKANPNWGVSVNPEIYLAELKEAIADPTKQTDFKTKRLNIWCNAALGFYNTQDWAACIDATLCLEDFAKEDCVVGLDLASKLDLCAAVLVFRRFLPHIDEETGVEVLKEHYYAFLRAWLPESVARLKQNTHFQGWEALGRLTVTKGNITDYGQILNELLEDAKVYGVREIAFDQREAAFLLQEFEKVEGSIPQFEVPQQTPVLSEPMWWLKSLTVDRRIHHDGNPLLAWAMSNVVAKPDNNKNVFPRRAADELKIDPHSALLNAMVRVREVLNEPPPTDFEVEVWS